MRGPRIVGNGVCLYHAMSRVVDRQMIFGDAEKATFMHLLRQVEGFCAVQVVTHCIMTNHFHLLLLVPEPQPVSDEKLARRLSFLLPPQQARQIRDDLNRLREQHRPSNAEALKERYTARMFSLSEFMKTLKQRFTQSYNRSHGRKGTLWEERFKSVLLENQGGALSTIAAYIDLNPVRSGIVKEPLNYPFCGYTEAINGSAPARAGIGIISASLGQPAEWPAAQAAYQQLLDGTRGSAANGRQNQSGLDPAQSRIRHFSDAGVLGSNQFVRSHIPADRPRTQPRELPLKDSSTTLHCLRKLRNQP